MNNDPLTLYFKIATHANAEWRIVSHVGEMRMALLSDATIGHYRVQRGRALAACGHYASRSESSPPRQKGRMSHAARLFAAVAFSVSSRLVFANPEFNKPPG